MAKARDYLTELIDTYWFILDSFEYIILQSPVLSPDGLDWRLPPWFQVSAYDTVQFLEPIETSYSHVSA